MRQSAPALCLVLLLLSACEPPYVERATQVNFDPAGESFWSLPLPSELRRQEDGTFNLERWPGPRPQLVKMWLETIDSRLPGGWGVNSGAFFTLSGAVDPATFPSPSVSLTPSASVQLIDVDPDSKEFGRRYPVEARYTADAITYAPASLLAVLPVQGFPRRASTLYAVVLTSELKDTAGQPLGRSRAFHAALEQLPDADPRAKEALAPLRSFLNATRFERSRVVGGTVFRTIDPDDTLKKLASWVETLPAPALEQPWQKQDEYADFVVYTARYRVPQVQPGLRPGKGRIAWTADGSAPVQQGTQSVRLSLTMPRAATASSVPLLLYLHGSGGEYRELIDRGPLPPTSPRPQQPEAPIGSGAPNWLSKRGIATMGFDFPLHGDRDSPPDTTGLKLYDLFGDIDSTVDNMSVSAMEVVYLTRLLTSVELPLPAGGTTRVDLARLSAMGHSMGSTIGIPVATVDPRIKGWVFSGAGAQLIEIASETTYPVNLRSTLELLLGFKEGEPLDRGHPLLHAFQALWDLADPSAKALHVAREPLPGREPRPFFLPQGLLDGYFHPGAQTVIGGALGTTLVGEEVDATLPRTLRLDGRGTTPAFPLKNNLNGVTAGTVQLQTPFALGHYVVFDVALLGGQVGCFVQGVGTPEGPAIVSPRALDAACD